MRISIRDKSSPAEEILVQIALTCGNEDLIIHSGWTDRERCLESPFSSVLFGPIVSLGVGISERAHVFFSATSENPNREQRVFSGSDHEIIKLFSGKTVSHRAFEISGIALGGSAHNLKTNIGHLVYQGMKFPDTKVKIPCSIERLIEN